jgi:hypothetical protein
MKLTELMHQIKDENESDLTPVDNWKATDCMYLEDMGFKNDGTYHYTLKNPEIRLSHKKGVGFIAEDKKKSAQKVFQNFKELEDYFANYKQDFDNVPYHSR